MWYTLLIAALWLAILPVIAAAHRRYRRETTAEERAEDREELQIW